MGCAFDDGDYPAYDRGGYFQWPLFDTPGLFDDNLGSGYRREDMTPIITPTGANTGAQRGT